MNIFVHVFNLVILLCNIHMDSSSTIHLHAQLVWLHINIVHAQCETQRSDVCYQDHTVDLDFQQLCKLYIRTHTHRQRWCTWISAGDIIQTQ